MNKINKNLEEMFECAISHTCYLNEARRCAICELGIRYVADEPVQLSCGHIICAKCSLYCESNEVNCKEHGQTTVGLSAFISDSHMSIKSKELFESMRKTFNAAIELLDGNTFSK
jgi:hypothetical protein